MAVWTGEAESDRLNALVLSAGLAWREIALVPHAAAQSPQVRVALARYKAADGRSWTTVGPAIEKGPKTFTYEKTLGDLMTAPPAGAPSQRIEECVPALGQAKEYRLAAGACESGWKRARTAGFVFADERPGTAPLYVCVARNGARFAATEETCEGLGTRETRLGYLLR